ncbi:MAG: diguanylate cyclase, partial [Clostridia bacterium]|nr:diguanylate cyclase [Clostridia bacterium]
NQYAAFQIDLFVIAVIVFVSITVLFNYIFLRYHLRKSQSVFENEAATAVEDQTTIGEVAPIQSSSVDILTKLPNRKQLFDYLQHVTTNQSKAQGKYAVFIINLDFFRSVNNNLGHEIGDIILQECANRLQALCQDNFFVARMDGDEFAVVMNMSSTDDLSSAADNLLAEIKKPMNVVNQEIYLSACIGISIFPDQGNSVSELIRNATAALNVVKHTMRNSYKIYSPEITEYVHQKFNLHCELRQAIDRNEFELHYQPKINGKTSQIVGIEALIRWNHPTRGLLYPIDFIPIAEETGIIKYIDEWVLFTACTQLEKWLREDIKNIRLAVNLSAWQFKDQHLAETVIKVLEDTGISPKYLELEITETTALENFSFTQNTLTKLMDMGVTISIDDFGTGYSTFNYLKHLPVDFLKIDKSFVSDIISDKNTYSIVRAIIDVAHALQLKVVAEGVENQDQLDLLMGLGCDEIQGYHISKPLNVEDIKKRICMDL